MRAKTKEDLLTLVAQLDHIMKALRGSHRLELSGGAAFWFLNFRRQYHGQGRIGGDLLAAGRVLDLGGSKCFRKY